jgi:hypothetical protein
MGACTWGSGVVHAISCWAAAWTCRFVCLELIDIVVPAILHALQRNFSPSVTHTNCKHFAILTVLLATMATAANPSGRPLGCRLQRVRRAHRCTACRSFGHQHASRHISRFAGAVLLSSALSLTPLTPTVDARPRLGAEEQKVVELFSKNTSSVVNITNLSSRRDAFTTDMQEYPQGAGSGIVWDTQGHIVVCYPRFPRKPGRFVTNICIASSQVKLSQ